MINDDTVIYFASRRAYEGFCPEKQSLLIEMRRLLFKHADQNQLEPIHKRLMKITFTPSHPGETRTFNHE